MRGKQLIATSKYDPETGEPVLAPANDLATLFFDLIMLLGLSVLIGVGWFVVHAIARMFGLIHTS